MSRSETITLAAIVVISASMLGVRMWQQFGLTGEDPGIPFYSTASDDLLQHGGDLVRKHACRSCHTLWAKRDMMQNVPAPSLDGIGSLREEQWLYQYLSAPNPQDILPSRLKKEYQMPSFAHLPDEERRSLATYLASLKVEDWYLENARKAEYEKLTGKTYVP